MLRTTAFCTWQSDTSTPNKVSDGLIKLSCAARSVAQRFSHAPRYNAKPMPDAHVGGMRQRDLGDEDGWMGGGMAMASLTTRNRFVLGSVQNLQMTWALVAFYAVLAVLTYFAMVG